MPSDNEIKQAMTEKVIPFFYGGGLERILDRLDVLEKRLERVEAEQSMRQSAQASVTIDDSGRAKVIKKGSKG